MSNAAASGGYYIAMNSEKIFANPTTITGSIGVFGIKFDASKLANDYGITTDEYPRGSHATTLNPLTPLTPDTKDNITRIIQDYYNYFKAIVSTGRSLSLDDVEKVAQGRVWTGEQAKEVGLVDAIGGLDRAVSYAKKTHAMTEHVEVDYYPRKLSLMEQLGLVKGPMSYVDVLRASVVVMMGFGDGFIEPGSTLHQFLRELTNVKLSTSPHFMMTMDEETALDVILKGE
jgi:ClpP class serine protease